VTYLGERLAEHDLVTFSNKVSDGEGISLNVSRGESLVCLLVSALLRNARGLTISKRARCFLDLTNSDSSFHCSWVGSIPVGFWAQAWSRNYYQLLPNNRLEVTYDRSIFGFLSGQLCSQGLVMTYLHVLLHTLKVKSDSLFVEVPTQLIPPD
jgi:hypothetical protein